MQKLLRLQVFAACVATATAHASPTVALDDPIYEELARQRALGSVPPYAGGLLPLSEERIQGLLQLSQSRVPARLVTPGARLWFSPLHRARVQGLWIDERARSYSTQTRPRDVAGVISNSCEDHQAEPCGNGVGAFEELETQAGYAGWLSTTARFRAVSGYDHYDLNLSVDRAHVDAEYGPIALMIGRDAFALGPLARTQLGWSGHAAPLDHVRISTSHPLRLTDAVHASGQYVLGRLRPPQTFRGTLVSIVRGQLDLGKSIEVGALQLLQLGGEGAPGFGFVDFLLEHVRRRDATAGPTDSSNRRFGGDIAARVGALLGARFYYSIVFEDIRRARLIDAIRYDADHLVGVELAAIGPCRKHGLTIEWHQTGVRSQEHVPRTTGFTNAGYVVGAPLGPDAESFYVGGRVAFASFTLYPWLEFARLSSDTYEIIPYGPINRTLVGEDEVRYRIGSRVRVPIRSNLWLEAEAVFEHIDDFAFQSGVGRNNGDVTASVVWYPDAPLGTLKLN